jgi:hypothetical protein
VPKPAAHSSAGPDSAEPLSIDGRLADPNKGAGGKNGYLAGAEAKPVATSTPMTVAMARTPTPPPVAQPDQPGLYYKADATPRRKEQQNDAAGREEEPAFSSSIDGAPANADGGVATRGDVAKSAENEKKSKVAQKAPAVDSTTTVTAANLPATSNVTGGERSTSATGAGAAGGGDTWGGAATGAKDESVNSQTESRPADDIVAPQAEVVVTGTTDTKSNAMPARWTSASATGPMDLIEAARAAGGRVISPSGTPPSLGKSGASTIVTVEIPASGWAAFSQKLKDTGTFEMTADVPAGKVRIRVEVVKK